MKTTDTMVLFWDGPFSNWYPSQFKCGDLEFNCGEQYMMYRKARFFNDNETAWKIMETDSPHEQKKLGRSVSNFNQDKWLDACVPLMEYGLRCKFEQNLSLKHALLETGTRIIAEASPDDTIWGIGLGEDDPRALDPATWRGKNLLGITLMNVRASL